MYFLLWGHGQKSLKTADFGKIQFCAQKAPGMGGGTILVAGRLGAAFYGKQTASFIPMFTKRFSAKELVTIGPCNLFGKKKSH